MEQRLQARDAAFDGMLDDDEDEHRVAPVALLEDRRYEPAETVENEEWNAFAQARMATALEALDERSRDIVNRRWLSEPKAKLRELADEYGISAERVRQIEAEAFAVLRDAVERHALPNPQSATPAN